MESDKLRIKDDGQNDRQFAPSSYNLLIIYVRLVILMPTLPMFESQKQNKNKNIILKLSTRKLKIQDGIKHGPQSPPNIFDGHFGHHIGFASYLFIY